MPTPQQVWRNATFTFIWRGFILQRLTQAIAEGFSLSSWRQEITRTVVLAGGSAEMQYSPEDQGGAVQLGPAEWIPTVNSGKII